LLNPRSFAISRAGLAERAAEIAGAFGSHVVLGAEPAAFAAATDRVVEMQQQLLIILGGDGTVQAVVDRLASLPAQAARPQLPQLLVLGGGRSNLTAADLGGRGAVLTKLETVLRRWRDGPALTSQVRHSLRIEQSPAPPRHGFFVAAGLVDLVIRACHEDRARQAGALGQGDAGTAWSVLNVAVRAGVQPGTLPLDPLRVAIPDGAAMDKPARLLIVTTLQGRLGSINPFAPEGEGALRFTAIAARGPGMWARLPWLLSGRFTRSMDPARGYFSGRCDALRVLGLTRYTLDGEEFDADPTRPVLIRKGPPFSFLTL
jgi:hypothetical protein